MLILDRELSEGEKKSLSVSADNEVLKMFKADVDKYYE